MDASLNKYATGGPDRGNSVNFGPLSTAKDDAPMYVDPEDETLLEQVDLDKLAEEFPGKVPENPWIKEQTNKQFLTQIKVSASRLIRSPRFEGATPLPGGSALLPLSLHMKFKSGPCVGARTANFVSFLTNIIIGVTRCRFNLMSTIIGIARKTCKCLQCSQAREKRSQIYR